MNAHILQKTKLVYTYIIRCENCDSISVEANHGTEIKILGNCPKNIINIPPTTGPINIPSILSPDGFHYNDDPSIE